ncbi:hypothetical protein KIN20_005991 [Parelaphostrongylus tenuis]|uniref:GSKIP domain-containing protein n=1 Tax=Parelaphostrongylus tenuis TaxID=148309 RepID=A0AAD5QGD3_PARTN|nr:hypothetical protein KIN20_005991 [Parelaphostrongylus tenuis]
MFYIRSTRTHSSMSPTLRKLSSLNRSIASDPGSRGESLLELEAIAAVQEISFGVQSIGVSEMLPRTPDLIFVNLTTLEEQPFCVEVTHKGWRITSLRCDCMMGDFTRIHLFIKYYDSLHSLMYEISTGYRSLSDEKIAQQLTTGGHTDESTGIAPFESQDSSQSRSNSLGSDLSFYNLSPPSVV